MLQAANEIDRGIMKRSCRSKQRNWEGIGVEVRKEIGVREGNEGAEGRTGVRERKDEERINKIG